MILRRLGDKKKIAKKIQAYFPPHKIYIEPFFGAGGMFFNKPKAKYNIVNDLDSDVFNLFMVVMDRKEELLEAFKIMPIHQDLLQYWKQHKEEEPIRKALRFLFLSNFTFLGMMDSIKWSARNEKETLIKNIDKSLRYLYGVRFNNCCFEKFINDLQVNGVDIDAAKTFIYCDPPYLATTDNYSNSFTEEQSEQLFNTLEKTGCKFAMSEFDHPFIIDQAKQRGLNLILIGERQNLKNRRVEVLVTNYENNQKELF